MHTNKKGAGWTMKLKCAWDRQWKIQRWINGSSALFAVICWEIDGRKTNQKKNRKIKWKGATLIRQNLAPNTHTHTKTIKIPDHRIFVLTFISFSIEKNWYHLVIKCLLAFIFQITCICGECSSAMCVAFFVVSRTFFSLSCCF